MGSMDFFVLLAAALWSLSEVRVAAMLVTTNPFISQTARIWWTTPPVAPTFIYTTWTIGPFVTGTQYPAWTTYTPVQTTLPAWLLTSTVGPLDSLQTGTTPTITATPSPAELDDDRLPYWYLAGALGGVVLLLILVIVILCCCRRKKDKQDPEDPKTSPVAENEYQEPQDSVQRQKQDAQAQPAPSQGHPPPPQYDNRIEPEAAPPPAPAAAPPPAPPTGALSGEDKNY